MAEDGEERTMELTIEALTGTVYDLCVSPYETILGIKMKVQRLEGIPVYQQQLVWSGRELQDDFCLEEYSIPSGAQLKLMVAMRGGPIHAQRVHLDLEDPTLLEIAELLDGDKYTLMVLRNGDDLDHASFVQFQMLEEDNVDALRLSPIQVADSGQHCNVTTSKAAHTENALTRDKMKDLMAKFKKGKEYRQSLPPLPNAAPTPSNQLHRKATGKVLILESRATSGLVHNSSRGTPLSSTSHTGGDARVAQRKLVFSGEECSHLHHFGRTRKRMTSCSLSSRRLNTPDEKTPVITRSTCPRVNSEAPPPPSSSCSQMRTKSHENLTATNNNRMEPPPLAPAPPPGACQTGLPSKDWQRASKRKRRTSRVETDDNSVPNVTNLGKNLSRLELGPTLDHSPMLEMNRSRNESLPPIPHHHHLPLSLPSATCTKGLTRALPSLSIAASAPTKQGGGVSLSRKKRCMKCGKRMGLASTYSCRCGGLFCAVHRYAEAHSCTFDYKTEGRQIIARSNPVVASQKLPKI